MTSFLSFNLIAVWMMSGNQKYVKRVSLSSTVCPSFVSANGSFFVTFGNFRKSLSVKWNNSRASWSRMRTWSGCIISVSSSPTLDSVTAPAWSPAPLLESFATLTSFDCFEYHLRASYWYWTYRGSCELDDGGNAVLQFEFDNRARNSATRLDFENGKFEFDGWLWCSSMFKLFWFALKAAVMLAPVTRRNGRSREILCFITIAQMLALLFFFLQRT